MGDVVDDALATWHAENDGQIAAPAAVPAPPAPSEKPRFSLNDVILDDPDLPPTLRGTSARDLYNDRLQAVHERDQTNFERNRLIAENKALTDGYQQSLQRLRELGTTPSPPPQPVSRLKKRGIDAETIFMPGETERTLSGVIEAGADEAQERLAPELLKFGQKLDAFEKRQQAEDNARATQTRNDSYRKAFLDARPPDVPLELWEGDYAELASVHVIHAGLPLDDPRSYQRAYAWAQEKAAKLAGVTLPQSSTQAAPIAPAPPVGAARTAPVQSTMTRKANISTHDRAAYEKVTNIFNKTLGTKVDTDATLNDALSDPKTRSAFP